MGWGLFGICCIGILCVFCDYYVVLGVGFGECVLVLVVSVFVGGVYIWFELFIGCGVWCFVVGGCCLWLLVWLMVLFVLDMISLFDITLLC